MKLLFENFFVTLSCLLVIASRSLEDVLLNVSNIWKDSTANLKKPILLEGPMPSFAVTRSFGKSANRSKLLTLIMSNSFSGEMPVGAISTQAMQLALDRLYSQQDWLPDYELVLELIDDECVDSTTINRVIPKLRENAEAFHRFPLFLSPACEAFGLRTVAESIKYFNFVGLATIQTSLEPFRNRKRFSSFFSIGEQFDMPHIALAAFIAKMGWKKVAILSEKFPYYDDLENTLLPLLDAYNVTLLWIGKVSHSGVYDDEMKSVLDEMIVLDPRIIIVDADRGAGKACWLHRYGLYGPNYLTFFFYWSDVYPTAAVPDNMDWCTIDMINEVMASSIILGDTTITDTFGDDIADSTGLTGKEWQAVLDAEIDHPEDSPLWTYWRMLAYDVTLFAGYVLTTTEAILRDRNETLLDWVTSSEKFAENGLIISDILKQAIFSTVVKGLKGEYHFDRSTKVNSLGFTPITFSQLQLVNGTMQGVLIAIYKNNEREKFRILSDQIIWRTHDGLPPRDSISVVFVERPPMPKPVVAVIVVFAVLEMLGIFVLISFIVLITKRPNLRIFENIRRENFTSAASRGEDGAILAGNVVLLSQTFLLPFSSIDLAARCYAIPAVAFVGYSTSIFGLAATLEMAHRRRAALEANNFWSTLCLSVWLVVQASLLGTFFSLTPFQVAMKTLAVEKTKNREASVIFQPFVYQCQLPADGFSDSGHARLSILAAAASLHVLLLLRTAFTAYRLKSKSNLPKDLKYSCTCFFCVLTTLLAGIFIGALINEQLLTVLSCIVIGYVGITSALSVATKFSSSTSSAAIGAAETRIFSAYSRNNNDRRSSSTALQVNNNGASRLRVTSSSVPAFQHLKN